MSRFVLALVSLAILAAVPRPAAAGNICLGLIERYQFNNYAQWWGMLGHCKRPGGPTSPDDIFTCGWHQVPMIDQVPCLEAELRGARYTAVAIDLVATANGKPTCAALTYKYTANDFAWWRRAISLCTGPSPLHIFQCAYAQVPPVEQQECLKEVLAAAPVTKGAVDDMVAASTAWTCTGMIDRYQPHDHEAWRLAFQPCKTGRGGPNDRASVVACAVSNLPPPDQADTCLMTYLDGAAVTKRMVAEVRAYNGVFGAVADHVSTAWFLGQEDCELPRDGSIPDGYYELLKPLRLADSMAYGNEGRVRSDLRLVARIADPVACALPLAAHAYAAAEDPSNVRRMDDLVTDARAYADLAVTGRKAFTAFRAETRLEPETYCADLASQPIAAGCPPLEPVTDAAALQRGCTTALRRAYAVANHLRTGQAVTAAGPWWTTHHIPSFAYATDRERKRRERAALGWIAVSGEDDLPHRPVNVPSTDDPQFDIPVFVPAPFRFLGFEFPGVAVPIKVNARAVIAQSLAAPITMPAAPEFALRPDLSPSIPADSEVLVFIHGMDSRAEEAGDITKALFARMAATDTQPVASSKNLVVVAVDLPSSGYTDTLDYERVSRLDAIGVPYGAAGFAASGRTPLLDFIEDFVVAFVEELDHRTPFRNDVKAVMGGSLGGNLSFRLGRRPNVPWLPATVVWSPASIWRSMGEGNDATVHVGPYNTWHRAADRNAGDPLDLLSWARLGRRAEFFTSSWDADAVDVVVPIAQPETWTNNRYPCKQSAIVAARLDRHETYDPLYLSWRWRLATEQLLYSHHTTDPDTGLSRYMSNDKRMLLACGFHDIVPYNHICPSTVDTAQLMTLTPGEFFLLDETGHAVANERPRYFAGLIDGFLGLR